MVITYYGKSSLRLQTGEVVVAVNPIGRGGDGKSARFGANIALSSTPHPNYRGFEEVSSDEKETFCIGGPGEYEVGGIFIKGISGAGEIAGTPIVSTSYVFNFDGIRVGILGNLTKRPTAAECFALGNIDLLFIPIGGGKVVPALSPSEAHAVAVSLEPKMIIPIGYEEEKVLQTFLKELGAENVKPEEKLTLKKKDLDGQEATVKILSAVNG